MQVSGRSAVRQTCQLGRSGRQAKQVARQAGRQEGGSGS